MGSPANPGRTRRNAPGAADSAEVRAVLDAIRHIVRVLRVASRAAEKRVGLSGAQLFVLQVLADEDALSLGELAERTFTHQSSVSVVVGRLVYRGLVRRERSTVDGRRLEVTLTRAGRILAGRAPAAAQGRLISGLERLDPGDRRVLARTLGCLLGEMGIGEEAAAMFFEDDSGSDRHAVKRTIRRSRAETP